MKQSIARLFVGATLAALLSVHAPAWAQDAGGTIMQTLETSMKAKKGLNVYINGQNLTGIVVKIEPGQWVEMRSQQFARIVVRMERIDAVAMQ